MSESNSSATDPDWQLHFAAQKGNLREVRRLVERGLPFDTFDEIGKTPLHYACEGGHINVVKYLIQQGADVNAQDQKVIGDTPLSSCAQTCSLEMARTLVQAGASPTCPGWMQITALTRAAKRKRGEGPSVHQFLLDASKRCEKTRT